MLKSWPDDWPEYYNACNEPCDMLIGPCCCGAWHQPHEFQIIDDKLYRDGEDIND